MNRSMTTLILEDFDWFWVTHVLTPDAVLCGGFAERRTFRLWCTRAAGEALGQFSAPRVSRRDVA